MKKTVLALALGFLPFVASAQTLGNIENIVLAIGNLVNIATPIVVGLALLAFFWGLVRYIFGGVENKEAGKNIMIWGVIALFVMVSVWGIVKFIGSAVGIGEGDTIIVPLVPGI